MIFISVIISNTKDFIKKLKNLEDLFDFSNLIEIHGIYTIKNWKVVGNFELKTPKKIWINEFFALGSKMYASKNGDDNKNKLKGHSKSYSKKIEFEEYKNCLDGEKYQEER